MNLADVGNAFFEGGLALLLTLNIRSLVRDKEVKGASLLPSIFVTLWGYWNMYYYPHLDQWLSFLGGTAVAVMNTIWLTLAIRYKWQAEKRSRQWTHDTMVKAMKEYDEGWRAHLKRLQEDKVK